MEIQLTDDLVKSVLPNTLITVDEEMPLAARIEPYVKDAVRWLEAIVVGDFELTERLQWLAERVVTLHACIHALPALDIVVTPSGFGVISSQGLAPASKERIERLIGMLSKSLTLDLMTLQSECVKCEEWRATERGKWYCSTFYPYLIQAESLVKDGKDLYQVYKQARTIAEQLENTLEEEYLGSDLMNHLRADFYGDYVHNRVLTPLHDGIERYVAQTINTRSSRCPDDHIPWHFAESILNLVKQDKKLRKIWKDSMGKKFDVEPFKNTRKGGYFF